MAELSNEARNLGADAVIGILAQGAAFEAVARPWQRVFPTPPEQRETLRTLLSHLFDGEPDGVALVPSAAFGLATAANSLPLETGDSVLVLEGQFPSNLLCWQQRCARRSRT